MLQAGWGYSNIGWKCRELSEWEGEKLNLDIA
jgi:hypothetical protein